MNMLIPVMQETSPLLCTVVLIGVCVLIACVAALIIGDTELPLK